MDHCLVIQPAYPGDAILALPVLQRLRHFFPQAKLHFVVRNTAQSLFRHHPAIDYLWIWNKSSQKIMNFISLYNKLRKFHFDLIINLHRFFLSGLLGLLLSSNERRCFRKNPLSFFYHQSFPHVIGVSPYPHEVERNLSLLAGLCPTFFERPVLHIPPSVYKQIMQRIELPEQFIVFAPGTVWKTKRWPLSYWKELAIQVNFPILVIGGSEDQWIGEEIARQNPRTIANLCGRLSFLESAAVIQRAKAIVCHDSAPMHLASGVNCPTIAIFCSTVPEFGFGPLADKHVVIQANEPLSCRPCGLHGHSRCPKKHFRCAHAISVGQVKKALLSLL